MERPKVTKDMIIQAASHIAENINVDPETIADCYTHPMDGYQLAREIERCDYCDFTMFEVEELDAISSIVSKIHGDAEKKWAAENDIQPPLPIGTKITQGVIDSVCEYSAARYRVKENGCTQEGRFLLVKFEDAKAK